MTIPLVDALRVVPMFAELSDEQLQWLASHGSDEVHEAGALVFELGSQADSMAAVLEGGVDVILDIGGQKIPFLNQRSGAVTGLLPFSRLRTYPGTGQAVGHTRLFRLHQSHFDDMLRMAPALGPKLVALMTDRVRETTRVTQQREKMMALGKLSAGLAHEINNPAAAAGRAAALLQERLRHLPRLAERLVAFASDPGLVTALSMIGTHAIPVAADAGLPEEIDGRTRSAREDAVMAWLDRHDVPETWVLADTFAEAGIGPDALEVVGASLQPSTIPALVAWFEAVVAAQRLAADVHAATGRVSELVGAIKVYSHMDRGGVRDTVNVPQGLDSTLIMLGHKLKTTGVTLERAYAPDLPAIQAYSGELNQVWTNLFDNALDAMPSGGTLRVQADREGSVVVVRIIDSGAGIPADIQPRIFEAFFTTKPVGQGTGLGLDIVQRIVVQQHGGTVSVNSRPGRTEFAVTLPITAP